MLTKRGHYWAPKGGQSCVPIDTVAKEHGFSLGELAEITPAQKRATVAPKYRHPENPEITWSGRGRKPAWIVEGLEAGKSLEDFAI
ncbi:H-NS histone family protein [Paracoccus sp. SSJ]|uniref:H-NS histone family protein n=1 Tax=Paracoccus sp. SSJ TaxID=3050636 RepID=UPI00254C650D|nr:H-NS histone family protein [Paracoccus sp. SSJ]MDK8873411.1 H-NS histone family protein [Paracoccus sp. SSJ]